MNINTKSFFFRRYLGYDAYSTWNNTHPESICDLLWRFFKRTLLYYIIAHITTATLITTITMGIMPSWPRNVNGSIVYFGKYSNMVLDFLIGMPSTVGQGVIGISAGIALILAFLWLLYMVYSGIIKLLPKKVVNGTVELVNDVSNSIRGKSCAKINLTNLPEDYNS